MSNRIANAFSRVITQDKSQGASQAMLYALNLKKKNLENPFIGIASMGYDGNPCNNHLNQKITKWPLIK